MSVTQINSQAETENLVLRRRVAELENGLLQIAMWNQAVARQLSKMEKKDNDIIVEKTETSEDSMQKCGNCCWFDNGICSIDNPTPEDAENWCADWKDWKSVSPFDHI